MKRNIIEQSQSALRDLVGLIPEKDRAGAIGDIMVLERAIYVLDQAIDFKRSVEAKIFHFNADIERKEKENDGS